VWRSPSQITESHRANADDAEEKGYDAHDGRCVVSTYVDTDHADEDGQGGESETPFHGSDRRFFVHEVLCVLSSWFDHDSRGTFQSEWAFFDHFSSRSGIIFVDDTRQTR
jgi:hypothetical protein